MERRSVSGFVSDFALHAAEPMFVQRRGYRTERISYADVARTSCQVAREFESRAIGKGDRVLLWGGNSAEWVSAFFGCALRGAIAVPMDDAAAPDFAARVRAQVAAKVLVCSRRHSSQIPGVPIIKLEELRESVTHHSSHIYEASEIDRDDPLEIIFTSGTTAEPKGVVITHGNVLSNIAPLETEIGKYLKYERWVHPIRFLNLLPLSHVFGQFLGMFLPPLMAGTIIFQHSLSPAEVIDTIHRERISVLVAVPRMLQSLKEKIERDLADDGHRETFGRTYASADGEHFLRRWWMFRDVHRKFGWKFWAFISGGAALDWDTEEFWGRLGYAVVQGYGLTETTSLISVNHPFHLGKGSIGKVLPGRELKLADDGEILVRGGGVAPGYWEGTRLETATGEDGWYRTGDIGALDSEGNLYFKGRKKEVLVTPAGMNVYPEDLEAALRRQPEVRDCVVVGLERGKNAEPCAALILHDGADAARAVNHANKSLAEYQRMREWFVWQDSDFPRTSTGKPRVNLIRDVLKSQHEGAAIESGSANPLAELISQISGHPALNLAPDASLEDDVHLTSLERVDLLSALEDRYQIDLSETRFSEARTIGDIQKMITGGTAGEKPTPRVRYDYPRWALRWPTRWVRTFAYYLLVRPAIMLLGWPRIAGGENLAGVKGPVLAICNHIDDVDVAFVQTALPARLRHRLATATGGEALQALRTPPPEHGRFLRAYDRVKWTLGVALLNLFPLPREAAFLKSFSYAGECVDRGYSVLVFPEGHHTTDGKLRPFRAGVGLLANQLRIPVVPLRIHGLFEIKQAGRKFAPPGKIRIRIGKPVPYEVDSDAHAIAEELQRAVENL
jgi:long-chain acyl-CoA synthetase